VTTNGIPASCDSDAALLGATCRFDYLSSATPTVTAVVCTLA
jgi:hypothetical protein